MKFDVMIWSDKISEITSDRSIPNYVIRVLLHSLTRINCNQYLEVTQKQLGKELQMNASLVSKAMKILKNKGVFDRNGHTHRLNSEYACTKYYHPEFEQYCPTQYSGEFAEDFGNVNTIPHINQSKLLPEMIAYVNDLSNSKYKSITFTATAYLGVTDSVEVNMSCTLNRPQLSVVK